MAARDHLLPNVSETRAMVKEQAELAVYWKKMSSFSRVGDLHSHSCGDPCERLCGLQQHRSWDTNRLDMVPVTGKTRYS